MDNQKSLIVIEIYLYVDITDNLYNSILIIIYLLKQKIKITVCYIFA